MSEEIEKSLNELMNSLRDLSAIDPQNGDEKFIAEVLADIDNQLDELYIRYSLIKEYS